MKTAICFAATAIGALLVGLGLGWSSGGDETPDACIEALDMAERAFASSAEGFQHASDAINAVATYNSAALDQSISDMDVTSLVLELEVAAYQELSSECRGE